nr:uncharacterized protein LOC109991696 isoform X2 [Labrus bergylta]
MNFHVNWTDEETQELLKVWSEEKIQVGLGESVRNERVYGEVSRRLAVMEMYRSAKQCRDKVKKLKLEYRKTKKHSEESWDIKKNFKWYDALDSIMREEPASREDTMIQKFMISDQETNLAIKTETPGSCSNSYTTSQSAEETPSPAETKEDPGLYIVQVEDVDVPSTSTSVKSAAMRTSLKDSRWSKREVQTLLTLWANPAVQGELLLNVRNNQVYARLSAALESLGFSKTPQKCREKIKKLKQDYRRTKNSEQQRSRTMWFSIIDDVLGSNAAAPRRSETTALSLPSPLNPLMDVTAEDETPWLPDEVQVLMTLWAQPNIQKQLLHTATKTEVFKYLSSELAMVGFNKTAHQCSMKVNSLKEEYKRTKATGPNGDVKSEWFAILDGVLGQCTGTFSEVDSSVVRSQTKSPEEEHEKDRSLSVSSLCLLVPTLRLMCGFAWQVVQRCNVMHYGKVEELVRVATELAPDLLTPREKVQILLRLRARVVLDLCAKEITANQLSIQPHLTVIKNITTGCTCNQEEREELENSKTNFMEVIQRLLEDKEERKMFFKEVFPLHYGQQYEAKLKTLAWKFISRLDSLLPVPDIKQTAEWLGSAPAVMEECGRLVLEPAELKALFSFQQQQSGITNKYRSQTGNMFLPRLSLPPKPNQERSSERQDLSAVDKDGGLFYCSKDEEPVEENTNAVTPTQQDCNKADEVLMLKDEEMKEPTTENSSNSTNHTPSGEQTCFLCSYSDDQVTGLMRHMREAHPVEKPSRLQPKEEETNKASKKASAETCASEIKSTAFPASTAGRSSSMCRSCGAT